MYKGNLIKLCHSGSAADRSARISSTVNGRRTRHARRFREETVELPGLEGLRGDASSVSAVAALRLLERSPGHRKTVASPLRFMINLRNTVI